MSQTLEPCPFCGHSRDVSVLEREATGENHVYCERCGARGPREAVAAWNRISKIVAAFPRMREALEQVSAMLTIPAAEYVPAIGECYPILDRALAIAEAAERGA